MRTLVFLILFTCAAINCGSQEAAKNQPVQTAPQTVAADDTVLVAAARNLTKEFGGALMSELQAALRENGPAYAVQVCQLKAQQIAGAHSGAGWSVKRVSEKWRNVEDRADSTEKSVLAEFAAGTDNVEFRTRWSGPDTARVFSYYQRIMMREMCLQCHGDIKESDPDLWTQIRLAYSYDKAVGYKVGDLRGMFVISAHLPTATASAKRLAEGTSIKEIIGGGSK